MVRVTLVVADEQVYNSQVYDATGILGCDRE